MSIDLSLSRQQQLLPDLPYTRPTLHIAGTNGKGSVSALLSSILLAASPPLRVGRFNSPHLVSVLDCITLDNLPVTPSVYARARSQVEDADRTRNTKLTGFELLTMAALRVFENEHVDVVVLEVGMGGRLDATNIVPDECILVSALAAVDLDHQAFLGETVSLIAREKAGIARPGKPFILGKQKHLEVEQVVKVVLGNVGGVLIPALDVKPEETNVRWSLLEMDPTKEVAPPPQPVSVVMQSFPEPLRALLPLHGVHQLDNLGTALGAIDALLARVDQESAAVSLNLKSRITPQAIVKGIETVKWPGRLSFHTLSVPSSTRTSSSTSTETLDLVILADGAHNPASASTLGAYITHLLTLTRAASASSSVQMTDLYSVPITYILALSHSPPKTPLQTLSPILPPVQPGFSPPAVRLNDSPSGSAADPPPVRKGMGMGVGLSSGSTSAAAVSPLSNNINVRPVPSVALLRFTPPDGMPWVKSVPPAELREVVCGLMPGLGEADVWVANEVDAAADAVEKSEEKSRNRALEDALRWAAAKQAEGNNGGTGRDGKNKARGLVVLAGSLYLVADFYRLLESGFR